MTIDTKNLRTLALAATPGPWQCHWKLEWSVRNATQNPMVYVYGGRDGKNASEKDSEYIAACSPEVVIQLLDALERKDAALRTCLDACKCVLEQVRSPPAEVDFAIEAINKEIGA